jgi:hypothetical protein
MAPSTLTHSEPPTASHKCYFEINELLLVYNRQQLKGVRYRPKTKRALHKNVKPSWVWNHGADIQAQGYDRLWFCKICHLKRDPKVGLLDARSTSTIIEHLRSKHHINPPGAEARPPRPPASDGSFKNWTSGPFEDYLYKQRLIDWICRHDIPFKIVRFQDTRTLLSHGIDAVEEVIPRSHTTIASWIKDSFEERRQLIKNTVLCTAKSEINLSVDS